MIAEFVIARCLVEFVEYVGLIDFGMWMHRDLYAGAAYDDGYAKFVIAEFVIARCLVEFVEFKGLIDFGMCSCGLQ